jgi:gamma-glutamyltranspeptidase / glutathione hydrolase
MSDYESYMINSTTAAKIKSRISDDKTHNVTFYDPEHIDIPETHGTSQMSVIDGDGMAISLTSTVNLIFGNKVMVPETGVIMNNEMYVLLVCYYNQRLIKLQGRLLRS